MAQSTFFNTVLGTRAGQISNLAYLRTIVLKHLFRMHWEQSSVLFGGRTETKDHWWKQAAPSPASQDPELGPRLAYPTQKHEDSQLTTPRLFQKASVIIRTCLSAILFLLQVASQPHVIIFLDLWLIEFSFYLYIPDNTLVSQIHGGLSTCSTRKSWIGKEEVNFYYYSLFLQFC